MKLNNGLGKHWLRFKQRWSRKKLLQLIEFTRAVSKSYSSKDVYDEFIKTEK